MRIRKTSGLRALTRRRPLVGGLLLALAGVEMFFSGQLDVGKIHVQVGIEGLQATVIPVALILLGALAIAMPVHRIFYGVIALVIAVYSLIGVNLGGFFIGMLLGSVGGILVVAWMPKPAQSPSPSHSHSHSQSPSHSAAEGTADAAAASQPGEPAINSTVSTDDAAAETLPLVSRRF